MAEPPSGSEARPTLLERLSALLLRAPEDREQLLGVLREAHAPDLLDADALSMIEGVLQVADLAARVREARRSGQFHPRCGGLRFGAGSKP